MNFYVTDLRHAAGDAHMLAEFVQRVGVHMDRAEAALNEYYAQRDRVSTEADAFLQEHYDRLRPHLRPCHQKRFDTGPKEVAVPSGP